jgi:hypothetical protein
LPESERDNIAGYLTTQEEKAQQTQKKAHSPRHRLTEQGALVDNLPVLSIGHPDFTMVPFFL